MPKRSSFCFPAEGHCATPRAGAGCGHPTGPRRGARRHVSGSAAGGARHGTAAAFSVTGEAQPPKGCLGSRADRRGPAEIGPQRGLQRTPERRTTAHCHEADYIQRPGEPPLVAKSSRGAFSRNGKRAIRRPCPERQGRVAVVLFRQLGGGRFLASSLRRNDDNLICLNKFPCRKMDKE